MIHCDFLDQYDYIHKPASDLVTAFRVSKMTVILANMRFVSYL